MSRGVKALGFQGLKNGALNHNPKGISKVDPPEPYGKLYKDFIGLIMGLYRRF